ncbi:hypothetical protein [Brevundimonas sp. LM2]|uniref:hypothetical protein n=1 Tax=Brevundimonas sp. LM2 TaxID=1938605 RepID=UPI0012375FFA|nr:hypothetical protein [Brevundimonas sp. LM2]
MSVTLVSRPAFAKQHGVSKAAVQKWESRGAVVVVDGKISVEASDRLLMHAGLGRFSNRARRQAADRETRAAPTPVAVDEPAAWDGEVKSLPYEARVLIAYVNRIAAHGGLTAWECGAELDVAQRIDGLFRFLAMDATAELLTDMGTAPPDGFTWADAPIWDDERLAQIDWSAVASNEREVPHGLES